MNKYKSFFQDKDGKIVIGQFPNWQLFLAGFFYIFRYINKQNIQAVGFWGLNITLLYWSYLEIRLGVNGWRKLLGTLVLISIGYNIISISN
ncbi:hypothetical protein COV58_02685 [Candidatus Roizmanbacteria bacterium CG11_big_fil_rev_8_21_14_0_20_36_8]|uniref:Uncharacterized protein n=1 Tax=Candidatus Roizmanbacteria bacterium CG11_big_fil_rev_8_21_14_0_20_36_8 TaxID=1974856 RepID=A0A2M6IU08_9BACT|nr:MAG: hypothetical protein COV58_02685 [Candidatus Roizmanbacteria bacterium CG11_big_fil_rev_8_21_14_0_20_36_8]